MRAGVAGFDRGRHLVTHPQVVGLGPFAGYGACASMCVCMDVVTHTHTHTHIHTHTHTHTHTHRLTKTCWRKKSPSGAPSSAYSASSTTSWTVTSYQVRHPGRNEEEERWGGRGGEVTIVTKGLFVGSEGLAWILASETLLFRGMVAWCIPWEMTAAMEGERGGVGGVGGAGWIT